MKTTNIKILLAASGGGHLTEGIYLFSNLPNIDLFILSEDSTKVKNMHNSYTYNYIWSGSSGRILGSFFKTLKIIIKVRPKWIISTGAECGIGALIAGKLLGRKTIFVETASRYRTRTKAARIAYIFVDHFYVQHEEALSLFGSKAKYIGGLL